MRRAVGLDPSFSVLDRGDAADLMDVAAARARLFEGGKALSAQGHVPRHLFAPRQHAAAARRNARRAVPVVRGVGDELTRLYRAYVERKLANQALDYDDLLLYWHAMMADERARGRDRRRSSTTSSWTSTRTRTCCRRRSCKRLRPERRRRDRRRRRRAGDLFVSRGDRREHPRLSSAVRSGKRPRRLRSSRSKRTTARRRACSTPPTR